MNFILIILDSDCYKNKIIPMLGSEYCDTTVKNLSALECAIADILYNTEEDSHLLSSIFADAKRFRSHHVSVNAK